MQEEKTHQIKIQVQPSDIDELGHVNNIIYLRWVQDVAVAHWQALTTPEEQKKTMWVVLRHEIDYKSPAMQDEEIIVKTWIGKAKRLSFERNTEIIRAHDEKLLARARTLWCPVNPETGRPQRLEPKIRDLFSSSPDQEHSSHH
ncbi:acyl-CoA thioesterase [Desulfonatronovibrio magnus]|uniref:acyl-CoA thioesterase n=1 Tax=Desulfonatronovibrio magnus TaxID=698827 RepID=UPI0005EAE795|nr:thioesterase family protein [Desulfonatronovibrio magnus]